MKTYLKLGLNPLYTISVLILISLLISAILFIPLTTKAETTSTIPLCEITRSLTIGSSGEDVRCLQRYLNWSGYTVSTSGLGSPGNESAYFGPLTANAVARWQNANHAQVLQPVNLTSGTGYWGPSSFNWYVSVVRSQLGA